MTERRDVERRAVCLRRLMDELGSPDLTLARSAVLRARISELLEASRDANPPAFPAPRVDRNSPDLASPRASIGEK